MKTIYASSKHLVEFLKNSMVSFGARLKKSGKILTEVIKFEFLVNSVFDEQQIYRGKF